MALQRKKRYFIFGLQKYKNGGTVPLRFGKTIEKTYQKRKPFIYMWWSYWVINTPFWVFLQKLEYYYTKNVNI
jgi:hypothetical protein